jgi:hypothetical protein
MSLWRLGKEAPQPAADTGQDVLFDGQVRGRVEVITHLWG